MTSVSIMTSNLDIMMAIKPVYAERIYLKDKTLEFRKKVATMLKKHFKLHGNKKPVRVYIYESYPKKMITGFIVVDFVWSVNKFVIEQFHRAHPKSLGIDISSLFKYYQVDETTDPHVPIGYAFNIREAIRFVKPICLWDIDLSYPPQDFIYLTPCDVDRIENALIDMRC